MTRTRLAALSLGLCLLPMASVQAGGKEPAPPKTVKARKAARVALKSKLSGVKGKIEQVRDKLHDAKQDEQAITEAVAQAKAKLTQTRAHLSDVKNRLAQTRREQAKVAALLAESEARLKKRELALAQRMAANYRQGPVRYASVLLGSRSMREMVSRAYVVRTVVRYDALLIAQIKSDRQNVVNWKNKADEKARQVTATLGELAVQQDAEARDTQRLRTALAQASAARAQMEDELATLESDSNAIAARIRALQETPVGRARQLIAFSGKFSYPTSGPITSGFGMRYHPILHVTKLHTGVDFGVPYGTPIQAAADGIVIFAGNMRGYGNAVVIDHGGGISTLYAHQSQILTGNGQTVTRGQVIGRVGSTGYSTGPHLHFEVRKNGTPVNPMGAL